MQYMVRNKPLLWMYASIILFTFHTAIPIFINSTFLTTRFGEEMTSLLYSAGSFLTIVLLLLMTRLLRRFGNYKTTLTLLAVDIVALVALALSTNPLLIIAGFTLHFILSSVISLNFDIFLERYTKDSHAGEVRGIYFFFANLAWLVAPFLAGLLLGDSTNYFRIYASAAIFLLPLMIIISRAFKNFQDKDRREMSLLKDLSSISNNKNVRNIFIASFLLRLFFAWMVIYTPLYLYEYIGFSFEQTGLIFSAMMFAYLFFEWPLGKLADERIGEKEIAIAGFIVIAITTAFLSWLTVPSVLLWAIAMFLTRVGAAMVEISTESYFFKHIDSSDTDDISFWRMTRPLGYLVAPLFGALFLGIFSFQMIFLAIGAVMLLGILPTLYIVDTK